MVDGAASAELELELIIFSTIQVIISSRTSLLSVRYFANAFAFDVVWIGSFDVVWIGLSLSSGNAAVGGRG